MTNWRPPEHITVGPLLYIVKWDHAYLEAHGLDGESNHISLVITLDEKAHPLTQKRVMVHEILHCCFHQSMHAFEAVLKPKERTEENIVQLLTSPILGVLRDNPVLLKWVTS